MSAKKVLLLARNSETQNVLDYFPRSKRTKVKKILELLLKIPNLVDEDGRLNYIDPSNTDRTISGSPVHLMIEWFISKRSRGLEEPLDSDLFLNTIPNNIKKLFLNEKVSKIRWISLY